MSGILLLIYLAISFKQKTNTIFHRNYNDTNFVMAYQNTLSTLHIHLKLLEDFALFYAVHYVLLKYAVQRAYPTECRRSELGAVYDRRKILR
jgi:hypothetical protein